MIYEFRWLSHQFTIFSIYQKIAAVFGLAMTDYDVFAQKTKLKKQSQFARTEFYVPRAAGTSLKKQSQFATG